MKIIDYLVIGSGCSGSMAAQTLVDAGVEVTMFDVGFESAGYKIPDEDFVDIRKTDANQQDYLIGKNAEGIAWGRVSKGAQLTPPRNYMSKDVDRLIPLESNTFEPVESLGYGGLGIGWGLQCWEFSDADLRKTGLDVPRMKQAYELISQRIGISGEKDDSSKYTLGTLQRYDPAAKADGNHQYVLAAYLKRIKKLRRMGFYVGRTPLALITKSRPGRKAYQYHDMDFYSDNDKSAWRPWITVDELKNRPNFKYVGDRLVTHFSEDGSLVTIKGLNTKTGEPFSVQAKKLIVASGALGTARIILRSQGSSQAKLPFLSNPHTYIPCIIPARLGKGSERKKLSLGQVSYFIDVDGDDDGLSVASSYSYQSLMQFRIINQIPLNFKDGRTIMKYLMPGMVIMIVQHPDEASNDKTLSLAPNDTGMTGDKLVADYRLDRSTIDRWERREKDYVRRFRKLNTYALKRVHTPHGSSVHYAGTLPFSETEKPLHLSPAGRLYKTKHVYVADSSGFNYLPAKGLTFSLMANAHITAENALHDK